MACGCVYEHRLIMEGILGRYLQSHEQVHHKDHDTTNNDPSNLVYCKSQKEHSLEHAYRDDELIDLLVRYADVYGRLPSKRKCDAEAQMPHSSTYIRRFKSWSNALSLAQRKIHELNEEWVR